MAATISGIGTAVPICCVTQDEAARTAVLLSASTPEHATRIGTLYRQTEVATRHMVNGSALLEDALASCRTNDPVASRCEHPIPSTGARMIIYEREALPLALEASRDALAVSGIPAQTITHLVTVSCTGFGSPGVDIGLIQALSLPNTVARTHIGFMGCHGMFNALRVARSFVESDPHACVLVCAVELCSQHYHFPWRADRMIANALFADGAASVVLSQAKLANADWRAIANGSIVIPDSADAMTWTIGDQGFEMTLSKTVPTLIARHLKPWLETWLRRHDFAIDDIASWAIHPGGPRIITAVEESLGLPAGATAVSREVLREFGNMSSATIVFILDRLRARNAGRPCVALAFGPGLTAEAMLFA